MKKTKKIIFAIAAILLTGLFMVSCTDDTGSDQKTPGNSVTGEEILILQAYASSDSAAGATHSFVELYNTTKKAIKLDGFFLYYADGHKEGAGTDSQWDRIALTGNIPAGGSFLITGLKQNDTGRLKLTDDYGDIIDQYFVLSNRAFKAALIKGTIDLNTRNILNPFDTDGEGTKVSGYIDMVGVVNDPAANDVILGFETAPARCSASEAVRRKNLTDTDNNQGVSSIFPNGTGDFDSIRYAAGGISDELLELRKPRNSKAGKWDPFAELPPPENETKAGDKSEYAGKLLILQAGASTNGAITRSFVELYNNTDTLIDLKTFSLQYGTTGSNWNVIKLTKSIPAKSSYLITGPLGETHTDNRLFIEDADQTADTFTLSNDGFKIALMENQYKLTVENPFAMTGGSAEKYVDMLGAHNNSPTSVNASETAAFTPISKQAAARRKSLEDTDNNLTDFERIDYRPSGISDIKLSKVRPRYSEDGEWDPFPPPPPGTEMLMILQIGAATDGNIGRSFIELYNNTDAPIDLSGYSVQYAAGFRSGANKDGSDPEATEEVDGQWNVITLTGTIQPYHSYLILAQTPGTSAAPALSFADGYGDKYVDFSSPHLSNRSVKVALMKNAAKLTVQNPFADNVAGFLDMIGAINTANTDFIRGFEGTVIAKLSKQVGIRRINLNDANENNVDFDSITYASVTAEEKERYRPKNHAHGAWNPMTGNSIVLP